MSEDGNRLSRWSQRKAAARRGDILPEPSEAAGPVSEDAQVAPESDSIAEGPAADDVEMPVLPPIDELNFESDYTVFLNKKVPEALRRAALRKLWTSDPVLACLDGLNDYDEDYNLVDTTITAAQTAYKVGRGYLEDIEEKLEQVDRALGQSPEAETALEALAAPEASETPDAASLGEPDAVFLGESDAAGDNSADALRHADAVAREPGSEDSPEDESK